MDDSSMDDDEHSFGISSLVLAHFKADYVLQDHSCSSDPDPKCPCGFVSILNYLMARQVMRPLPDYIKIDGKSVDPGSLAFTSQPVSVLREFVRTQFMNNWTRLKNDPEAAGPDFESDRICISNVLDSLPRAMYLKQALDSPIKFDGNPERYLFSYLGIPLLHGWLVDPDNESELYEAFVSRLARINQGYSDGSESPEQQSALMSDFYDSTNKTQLTRYGLACVRREVKEKSLAILYVKGHYRVIYNHQGTLFSLVTSMEELAEFPLAVWKSVELDDGDEFYVEDTFVPVEGQKNMAKAKEWLNKDIEETVRRVGLEDNSKPTKKEKKAAHTARKEKSASYQVLDGASARSPSPGQRKSALDGARSARSPSPARRNDPEEAIYANFTDFLWNFKSVSSVPYFEGVVKLMHHVGILVMHIPFAFIKQHNKSMAMYVQDHYESIQERLRQLVADYLVSQKLHIQLKLEQTDVLQQAKLEIIDLPEPKCTQSFEDFVSDNEMLNGDSTSYIGRNMASGFLSNNKGL